MKTILQILEEAGEIRGARHISIENDPWMRLVIEVLSEPGPDGHIVVSVAHYGEQNSDPMRDPEMLFEVVEDARQRGLWPFYFRNDYAGVEQWSRYRAEGGELVCLPKRTRDMEEFARIWDRSLTEQGFLEAFRRQVECGRSAEKRK
jgi:Domain of unknown function (DUF6908)